MHGSLLPAFAEIAIPDAQQCLRVAAPILAVAGLVALWRNSDEIINRLFPHWEFEKKLGWLNFKAHQRAETFLRGLGYFIYALLAAGLLGILWAAQGLAAIRQWDDIPVLGDILLRVPVLLVSLGFWLFYLFGYLVPKMRGQYEEEELEKFREEQRELERDQDRYPESRLKKPMSKPRLNSLTSSGRERPRRR